jgi:hypothetical protein
MATRKLEYIDQSLMPICIQLSSRSPALPPYRGRRSSEAHHMNLIGQESKCFSDSSVTSEQYDVCKLAYAAGYFDGEGSIGILSQGDGKGLQLRVEIRSCDLDSLRLFKDLFGGSLRSVKWARIPYPVFRWAVNNEDAIEVLRRMAPFLRAKGKEAQLVLDSGWDTLRLGIGRLSECQKEKRTALRLALQDAKKQNRGGSGHPKINGLITE